MMRFQIWTYALSGEERAYPTELQKKMLVFCFGYLDTDLP